MNTFSNSNRVEQMRAEVNAEIRAKSMEQRRAEPWVEGQTQLALESILRHLPKGKVQRVLDIGDDNGFYAVEMAKRGCFVELIANDNSSLEYARHNAVTAGLGERIRLTKSAVAMGLSSYRNAGFTLILVHLLLEYTTDYPLLIKEMGRLLRPDGLLSIVYENRYATAMRLALKDLNPKAALEFLTGQDRILVASDSEGFTLAPEQVNQAVAQAGLRVIADYGIGVFSEYASDDKLKQAPDFAAMLLELERTAAPMEQYRGIARYRQVLAKKI